MALEGHTFNHCGELENIDLSEKTCFETTDFQDSGIKQARFYSLSKELERPPNRIFAEHSLGIMRNLGSEGTTRSNRWPTLTVIRSVSLTVLPN
jgi:hypothetical protein